MKAGFSIDLTDDVNCVEQEVSVKELIANIMFNVACLPVLVPQRMLLDLDQDPGISAILSSFFVSNGDSYKQCNLLRLLFVKN